MYLSDIHTHSIASGHGTTCTISDMAKAASQKGLKLLGITDHGPATLAAGTSSYFRSLIYSPRKRFDVELLYGIELNILDTDGKTDLPQELLDKLDYAIASMHYQNFRPATCDGEFFYGKEIFVIGGGFAAAEESVFLTKFASHVTILIRDDDFSCAKAVAEAAKNHPKITVLTNTEVVCVEGDHKLRRIRYRNRNTRNAVISVNIQQ